MQYAAGQIICNEVKNVILKLPDANVGVFKFPRSLFGTGL